MAVVGETALRVLRYARYAEAHPDEPCEPDAICDQCLVAVRPDTDEEVLLWHVGNMTWSVSRADPHAERHRADLHR